MRFWLICMLMVSVFGCSEGEKPASAIPQEAEPPTDEAPPSAKPDAAPTQREQPAYVLTTAVIAKQATSDRKIVNQETGKKESNWRATLYRGEQITVLKTDGQWSMVRASDGTEGFIKTDAILLGENVVVATVLDETKTFIRPTFMAPSKHTIEAGTLLFITQESPDKAFGEVNYRGTSTLWVDRGKLVTDATEVAAAGLVTRARYLEGHKDDQAKQYWELAKERFGETKVVRAATGVAQAEPEEKTTETPPAASPTTPPPAQAAEVGQ